ncbi:MAG: hypothetical protein ACREPI_00005, partial [Candidatus Dormibacterales bacterium]
ARAQEAPAGETTAAAPALTAEVPGGLTPWPAPPVGDAGDRTPAQEDLGPTWRRVLEGLTPAVRAYYREARPERSGTTLVLSFRYAFHHQKAMEHEAALTRLVFPEMGEVRIEFRLLDAEGQAPAPTRPPAPEEHPVVQAAVRKLEGRVTRVREIRR